MPAGDRRLWTAALCAALLLTASNAGKPLVIDDPVYVAYARQVAAHPADPYSFEFQWYDVPEPAIRIGTVPPVVPYWLALSMTLFGDRPIAWKLSLLPFAIALTGSLAVLLQRLAKPFATPVMCALALGPAVLPSLNLMLDVPAIALGLTGYALFVRGCELRDGRLALASGIALGLALQTKYSAAVYPALVLAHATLFRRPREGALALVTATALFVGWETLIVARYGESHFLAGIQRVRTLEMLGDLDRADEQAPGLAALYWTLALASLLGGTACYAGLLALVGLAARLRILAAAVIAAALALAAVAVLPEAPALEAHGYLGLLAAEHPAVLLLVPLGLFTAGCVALTAVTSLRASDSAGPPWAALLVAWLTIEVAGYFVISPYPAVRRVIGLGIAATLLTARAAAGRASEQAARVGVGVATAFTLVVAAIFFGSDLADARARRAVVEHVARQLAEADVPGAAATVWYVGHWEVQFYGERAGWRAMAPGRSRLRAGDWLVVPDGVPVPPMTFPPAVFRLQHERVATSPSPWSTVPVYYSGAVPLRRQPQHQTRLRVYRVTRDGVFRSGPPPLR